MLTQCMMFLLSVTYSDSNNLAIVIIIIIIIMIFPFIMNAQKN